MVSIRRRSAPASPSHTVSGFATPESLSREGSPTPDGALPVGIQHGAIVGHMGHGNLTLDLPGPGALTTSKALDLIVPTDVVRSSPDSSVRPFVRDAY